MAAAGTLAAPQSTTTEELPRQKPAPANITSGNRIDEHDADYTRLHAATVARLQASIRRYVRDLRSSGHDARKQMAAAQSFVQRHTRLLREAYAAGWREGLRDYYDGEVSARGGKLPHDISTVPDDRQMGKRLSFYAPSVAKMAAEGLRALHASHLQQQQAQAAKARFSESSILLTGGHEPGYQQNRDNKGRWAVGNGGRQEAHDGAGGKISVGREGGGGGGGGGGGKGYHLQHTGAGGELIHEEHGLSLTKVNSYAKAHGIDERLMRAHFAGEEAARGEPGAKEAKAAVKAGERLATVRARLDERMAQREELYAQQHDLLAKQTELENQQRNPDSVMANARHAARIDLYHQTLDKNDPEVKAYFKARDAYRKNQADIQAAKTTQDAMQRKMNLLAAHGKQHSADFLEAKAAYDEAARAIDKANNHDVRQKLWTNFIEKGRGIYKPEFDSIAGFEHHMQQMGMDINGKAVENHPLVVAARERVAELSKRIAEVKAQVAALNAPMRQLNTQIKADLTRLRTLGAQTAHGSEAQDAMRPFNDVLSLPEGHQPPNALMHKLDYNMHEPRAVTKQRIINDIAARLKGNAAWEEYVARMPTPNNLGVYHQYVDVKADAHDTKSAKLVADLVRQWGVGYRPGSPKWVALQTAVKDEFGLDAQIHYKWAHQAHLSEGAKAYERDGAAYRAFTRAMYENTQQWLADRGITELELYRGFHWSKGDAHLPQGIEWGDEKSQNHGITDIELNPLQSFSADINVSQGTGHGGPLVGGFTSGDYQLLIGARIPADRILSTAQTGFGAKLESEVVVMGRASDTVAYRAGTRVESALPRQAHEEMMGANHKAYKLPNGTEVHVVNRPDGAYDVTYHAGSGKVGSMKVGDTKTYKTVQSVNKLLRRMRIGNVYSAPETPQAEATA